MPKYAESNACITCAKSKRKCGRQMPSCARCVEKGLSCVYPPSRSIQAPYTRPLRIRGTRDSIVVLENESLPTLADDAFFSTADFTLANDLIPNLAHPLMDSNFSTSSKLIRTPNAKADWFLAPDTWKIVREFDFCSTQMVVAGRVAIRRYLAVLQLWIERWVASGSNPFIHHLLYSASFPTCVQIAYATMACYIHRTATNTDTVLQVVEDRSNDLLQEHGAVLNAIDKEEWVDGEERDVDLCVQLARLHALMLYQYIGLFDGDIRTRHVAEGHMAVQKSWAHKLLHSAAKAFSNTSNVAKHQEGYLPTPATQAQQQWYLWILSESIRRTWIVAVSLNPIYTALQQRWVVCPGSIMFTNSSGLWDAKSAFEWEKLCSKDDVRFTHRFEGLKFFEDAKPQDIDEFGTAIMDMTFNEDLLAGWRERSGGS